MLTFPKPRDLDGMTLRAELRAAGVTVTGLYVRGNQLTLQGTTDRPTVERVLAQHVPPPPPSPQQRRDDARRQLRSATTLDELRAALDELLDPS